MAQQPVRQRSCLVSLLTSVKFRIGSLLEVQVCRVAPCSQLEYTRLAGTFHNLKASVTSSKGIQLIMTLHSQDRSSISSRTVAIVGSKDFSMYASIS